MAGTIMATVIWWPIMTCLSPKTTVILLSYILFSLIVAGGSGDVGRRQRNGGRFNASLAGGPWVASTSALASNSLSSATGSFVYNYTAAAASSTTAPSFGVIIENPASQMGATRMVTVSKNSLLGLKQVRSLLINTKWQFLNSRVFHHKSGFFF